MSTFIKSYESHKRNDYVAYDHENEHKFKKTFS